MDFEWDAEKERLNVIHHGIRFDTAAVIFDDPFRVERHDDDRSIGEERWQTIGMAEKALFVVYTERGDVTRIISARLADAKERRIYHDTRETLPYGWERIN
jgi:uncharacterized DUF497 family protein